MPEGNSPLILGLDIGTNSIGWALVQENEKVVAAGVRIFEAGTAGTSSAISAGKDEPRGAQRRQARLSRRMLARRAQRLRAAYRLLSQAGLLPACDAADPSARAQALDLLDERLRRDCLPPKDGRSSHLLPYILRAKALDGALAPQALGRAFYHLAQRRGFLSNRRAATKNDEDLGKVKSGIQSLEDAIKEKGARTLGEYFAGLDPEAERIRKRWTGRQMYLDEFAAIWKAQIPHHPTILTAELEGKLRKAIFFQRPLKNQKHLVGKCLLEPAARRAAWPMLDAQRFRLLQKVNDLMIVQGFDEYSLLPEQRLKLIEALEKEGDITFPAARKLLELPKGTKFNLEGGDEPKLPGNRTSSRVGKVFGALWNTLSKRDRDAVVLDLLSIQKEETLVRRAVKRWSLGEGQARELARVGLEDGYCSLSGKAIRKLLPRMELGESYGALRKELFPKSAASAAPLERLKPAPGLRNPIVERALTQLRKVVSAVTRAHGKPDCIRVELARDLKRPRQARREMSLKNRDNQRQREDAVRALIQEAGIKEPRRSDIDKYLLWVECSGICPYTGASISLDSIFGASPQFDVEHIIPYSRSLDDSFLNKTLCHLAENRNAKRNRTPFEAYGGEPARFDEMLQRVKRFQGRAAKEKLRRFKMTPEEVKDAFDQFSNRHLQDTRFASVEAGRYLGALYGCRGDQPGIDAAGSRRIQVSSGAVTGILRGEWGLNAVLDDGGQKNRGDHRHHAVDALVTALAGPGIIATLSSAAESAPQARRRRFAPIPPPWPTLLDDARRAVGGVVVSHAVSRKVSGPLHEETLYSPPKLGPGGKFYAHVRKPLSSLSKGAVDAIVDPVVQETVRRHLEIHGGDPKKAFTDANPPLMPTKSGKRIPILSARIRVADRPAIIGEGNRQRQVMPGSNHHMEVVETKNDRGKVKWEGVVVTMLEAARRMKARRPIVNRDHGPERRYICSLAIGDSFQTTEAEKSNAFIVRGVNYLTQAGKAYGRVEFVTLEDARPSPEIKKAKQWKTQLLEPLRKAGFRKVSIDPIGRIWPNNE